jgi:acetylornithine deacetylase/succinyl-diaminopimelate desuccinylase-like protein
MCYELRELFQRINDRRMRELLHDFVRIPSSPGTTAIATEWYAGYLRASGAAEVQLVRGDPAAPSLIAGFPGVHRGPILEVQGHIGDYPPGLAIPAGTADTIHGPGLIGAKAELVAAAEAARVLADGGPLPGGGLLFAVTPRGSSEQERMAPVTRLIERGALGDAVLLAGDEHAVAPVVGLGHGTFTLTFFRGSIARGNGESTPIDAAQCCLALLRRRRRELARHADPLAGPEQIVVQEVRGGPAGDGDETICSVKGAWHWLPGRAAAEIYQELHALGGRAAARHHSVLDVVFTPTTEGFVLDRDEPLVQALHAAYAQVMHRPLPAGATRNGNCAGLFLRSRGVPAIAHGLDPHTRGTPSEAVTMQDLVQLTRIYLSVFLQYLHPALPAYRVRTPADQGLAHAALRVGGQTARGEPDAATLRRSPPVSRGETTRQPGVAAGNLS